MSAEPPPAEPARVIASLRRFVERTGLPPPGAPLLVGCSGGADSSALLLALATGWPLIAVYIDHGLRAGTDAEAAVVAELARSVGASFRSVRVQVERRGNLLARAREARYAALARAAVEAGVRFVVVGHTATDQAETVAFRTARNDVPHALAGMPAVRPLAGDVTLLRPLLDARRIDTAAFVAARGLVPVDDPSNARLEFTRVRLRAALAAERGAEERFVDVAAHAARALAADDQAARLLGPLDDLEAARLARSSDGVLLRLLHAAGLRRAGRAHASALRALALRPVGTRRIDLGEGLVAIRRYQRVSVVVAAPEAPLADVAVPMSGPGRYPLPGALVEVRAIVELCAPAVGAGDALDPARLPRTPWLRRLRPGDFWRGRAGRRKLQDVMVDAKLPRDQRRRLPLLAASPEAGEVYWVAGLGVAPACRAPEGCPGWQLQILASPTESEGPDAATAG